LQLGEGARRRLTSSPFRPFTGKKYLTIVLGTLQGFMSLALGLWQAHVYKTGNTPALGTQMGIVSPAFCSAPVLLQSLTAPTLSSKQVVIMAVFNEMANGANFSLTPHTSPYSNGLMTGLVGAFGNMGGVFFALIFRYCPANAFSKAWWISGVSSSSLRSRRAGSADSHLPSSSQIVAIAVNLFCIIIPAPKH